MSYTHIHSFLDYCMLDLKAIVLSRCTVQLPGDSDTLCLTIPAWEVGVGRLLRRTVVQPLCWQQDGEVAQLCLEPSLAVFGSSAWVCSAAARPWSTPRSQTELGSTPSGTTHMLCDPRRAIKPLLTCPSL